jgi:hypothetical protein
VSEELDRIATALRVDSSELGFLVEVFAGRLEATLGSAVRVERRSKGFLSREKELRRLVVDLGDDEFVLERDGARVRALRRKEVRGVVIRSEELAFPAWVEALTERLGDAAHGSEATRRALQELGGL